MKAANVAELLARFASQAIGVGRAREYPRAVARRIIAEATTNRFGVERLLHAGEAVVSPSNDSHASWMQTVFFRNTAAWAAVDRAPPSATFGIELVSREGHYAGRSSMPVELRSEEELEHELRSLDNALALAVAHAGVELPAGAFDHLERLRALLALRRAHDPARIEALLEAHGFSELHRVPGPLAIYAATRGGERVLATVTAGDVPRPFARDEVRGVLALRDVAALGPSHAVLVEALPADARRLEDAALPVAQGRGVLVAIARALLALEAASHPADVRVETIFVDDAGALAGFSPRTERFAGDGESMTVVRSFAIVAHALVGDTDDSTRAVLERALHGDTPPTLDELIAVLTV